ncbi:crossover junction endodeoxyribonuclease RuvC [Jannaschia sp. CCS1]|nr:crossover junction endodeoxyribonuclease RuvC [Jannaschia sp. CCS1]
MFAFRANRSKRPGNRRPDIRRRAVMRIIGIDPGLRSLGWGVIEASGGRLSHVANGQCKTEGRDVPLRLLSLHTQLSAIVARYAPDAAAVEQTFVNRDGAGTLKLGQARGIAVLVPAQAGLDVGEYAPNAVKKAVVGVGHADKTQVEHMVKLQLPGCAPVGPDAADALAIAICHSFHVATAGRLAAAIGAAR